MIARGCRSYISLANPSRSASYGARHANSAIRHVFGRWPPGLIDAPLSGDSTKKVGETAGVGSEAISALVLPRGWFDFKVCVIVVSPCLTTKALVYQHAVVKKNSAR